MEHRSPAHEATLLLETAQNVAFEELMDHIRIDLSLFGSPVVDVERLDNVYYLIKSKRFDFLLALDDRPLPMDGFLDALGSKSGQLNEAEILRDLTNVAASATLLVLENCDPTRPVATQDILQCEAFFWTLMRTISDHLAARLVFLADTETLVTQSEFERICMFRAAQRDETTPAQSAHALADDLPLARPDDAPAFDQPPTIGGAMLDWMESGQSERLADEEELVDEAPGLLGAMLHHRFKSFLGYLDPQRTAARLAALSGAYVLLQEHLPSLQFLSNTKL